MSVNQISFKERPAGNSTMSPEMQNATNYYKWTVSQVLPYMRDHVLDVGGGNGAHLEHILPVKPNVQSVDLSQENVDYMNQRFADYPQFNAEQIDFGADSIEKLVEVGFDTIVSLNVLEHIEDDVTALKQMRQILEAQNGVLTLQVPALRWLYGTLDREAGHYRRYTVTELKQKLEQAGFNIVRCYYFNIFGVLPWYISGRVSKNDLQSGSVNWQIKVFNTLTPVFRTLETIIPPPFGQSVMAIATVGDKS